MIILLFRGYDDLNSVTDQNKYPPSKKYIPQFQSRFGINLDQFTFKTLKSIPRL